MVMMVKRELFVSYHYGIDKDEHGFPDTVGFGNRVMHLHATQLKDGDGLRELEDIIARDVSEKTGMDDVTIVLLNWKWMGD